MLVRVQIFAQAKEFCGGVSFLELSLPEGASVSQLRDELGASYPTLLALLPACRFAVSLEFVEVELESTRILSEHFEIALIQPVSGG